MSTGTPGSMVSQLSSLPMKQTLASLWARTWQTVSAAKVGDGGTETQPKLQMTRSVSIHQEQFLNSSATREHGSRPWAWVGRATQTTRSPIWIQVSACTTPLPRGCVRASGWVSFFLNGAGAAMPGTRVGPASFCFLLDMKIRLQQPQGRSFRMFCPTPWPGLAL